MIFSTSRKFIFLHIPKTGGEAITATLKAHIDLEQDLVLDRAFNKLPRRKRKQFSQFSALHKHSDVSKVMSVISCREWETHFKFAFVRDPIDRCISFYNYCGDQVELRNHRPAIRALYYATQSKELDPRNWPGVIAFQNTGSFSEFIRHPDFARDIVTRPQFQYLCDVRGRVAVDLICHYEDFENELERALTSIGLPALSPEKRNVSKTQRMRRADLLMDDRLLLAKRYEVDFEHFGYEWSA